MSEGSAAIRLRREQLRREQDNRCFWCKREMTDTALIPRTKADPPYPDTMCTLDHVFSKFHPRRARTDHKAEKRRVAACLGCNQRRCREEQAVFQREGKRGIKRLLDGTARLL